MAWRRKAGLEETSEWEAFPGTWRKTFGAQGGEPEITACLPPIRHQDLQLGEENVQETPSRCMSEAVGAFGARQGKSQRPFPPPGAALWCQAVSWQAQWLTASRVAQGSSQGMGSGSKPPGLESQLCPLTSCTASLRPSTSTSVQWGHGP